MSSLCLAILDQYFATSVRSQCQQKSNIKLAHRLTTVVMIICILHGIPYLIYFTYVTSLQTNQTRCQISDVYELWSSAYSSQFNTFININN